MDKHEIDFSKAIKARYTKMCDQCSEELDDSCCLRGPSLELPSNRYNSETKHFCDLECLKEFVVEIEVGEKEDEEE